MAKTGGYSFGLFVCITGTAVGAMGSVVATMAESAAARAGERLPGGRYASGTGISARARRLGLHSLSALKLAVLRQRRTWWAGKSYHCALCDVDFVDSRRAAEHVVLEQHPVLRMD